MKINATDFQPGGFDIDDSAHAVGLQDSEGVDLVEISGGTYESGPRGSRGSFRLGLEGVSRAGLPVARRYGTRIADDLLTSNEAKSDPDYFAGLLKLELALCDQEPFIRVGAMYQLVATRA